MATETAAPGKTPPITAPPENKRPPRQRTQHQQPHQQQPFQQSALTDAQLETILAKVGEKYGDERIKTLAKEVAQAEAAEVTAAIAAGTPVRDKDWEKAVALYEADVMRKVGLHAEAAIFEHKMLGIGDGKYNRTFTGWVKETWNAPIRVKDVVLVGGAIAILVFLYELVAERSGWWSPNFFVTAGSSQQSGTEMATVETSNRRTRGG